ncbi:helix-turn-helix domain-containing protein [Streptomyces chrestomyceticus]|uniref:helix-turn-helix domain-containing protein n=1 Tax=Streptomyces chrestomyceticus TaxID=68185 RepID=UPI0019D00EF2
MGTGTPAAGGFGALLHSLRQGARLTQEELAQAAGISVRALSYMERGRSRGPQRRTVQALAAALRLSPPDARAPGRLASLGRPRRAPATEVLPPAAASEAVAPAGAPDLLPRAPRGFHGRAAELAAVSRATAGEAPVCLVIGPAGVGKTTLVLHWAHQNRAAFPDGRLHADLRGFGDTGEPSAMEVLREFLPALGVAHDRIPESVNGAAALFRSLAADRQLLVVLDNARDSEQVRPLLPGGRRCVTVVTSRHRLPGLIVTDTARPVAVDVLGPTDATMLLAGVLGAERVGAEPAAARRLAELCGGLPLALRVAAARLAQRPAWPLDAMAAELSDETRRLSLLDVEDTGVRAALRLTLQQLPEHTSRLFARLGCHPGTHVDRYAAAALADTDPAGAAGFGVGFAAIPEKVGGAHDVRMSTCTYASVLTVAGRGAGPRL